MLFKKELNDAGKNMLNMQMFKNVLGSSFEKNLQLCRSPHCLAWLGIIWFGIWDIPAE